LVEKFDPSGAFLLSMTVSSGSEPSVAVGADGSIFVTRGSTIYKHLPDGTFDYSFLTSENGEIGDLAVDGSGNLWMVDRLLDRLEKWAPGGTRIFWTGAVGSHVGFFDHPLSLDVFSDGRVAIGDTNNHRIQIFSNDGAYLSSFGIDGAGDGEFNSISGVAVDPLTNYIYVVDRSLHRVQVFDDTGYFLAKWGRPASFDGSFSEPLDAAVGQSGNLYIVDGGNDRIQIFGLGSLGITAVEPITWGRIKTLY
jgi:DNA-binding beta-propeller fold protein YncE